MFPYCLLPSNAPRWKVGGHSAELQSGGTWVPSGVAGGPASMSVEGVLSVGFWPGGLPLSWKPKWTKCSSVTAPPLASAGKGAPEVWVTWEVTKAWSGSPVTGTNSRHVGFDVKWLSRSVTAPQVWFAGIVSFNVPKNGGLPDVALESFL